MRLCLRAGTAAGSGSLWSELEKNSEGRVHRRGSGATIRWKTGTYAVPEASLPPDAKCLLSFPAERGGFLYMRGKSRPPKGR